MPGKLQAALAWSAIGPFRVFPLQVNGREPLNIGWTESATTDPEKIRQMWTDPVTGFEQDYNIGFLCNGWIVIDVDVKNGKRGLQTHAALRMDWDTLCVITPSGGFHHIYKGIDHIVGNAPLAGLDGGIDTRSHNGYVIAAGSSINGKTYQIALNLPVAEFPQHLRGRLKPPRARVDIIDPWGPTNLDTPETVEQAAYWLARQATPAIEGQHGNDTTYRVACRVRDHGLSESMALSVMLELYNPRCEPPWAPDELERVVSNAYRYASGAYGTVQPEAVFGDVQPVDISPNQTTSTLNGHIIPPNLDGFGGVFKFNNMIRREDMRPREWIVEGMLLSRSVTAIFAAGAGGKSSFTLLLAAHIALGLDLFGRKVYRPGKSIIFNAEDDEQELARRMTAICQLYNFPEEVVRERVSLNSRNIVQFKVTERDERTWKIHEKNVKDLIADALDPEVVMIALDPLVALHGAKESDPTDMDSVLRIFIGIADMTHTGLMLVHHTAKPPLANAQAWVGDQHAGRGTTSVPNAARIVLTLFRASEADCLDAGIPPEDRRDFVRLDGAKGSYARNPGDPNWMRFEDVQIHTGDHIGVLRPHDAESAVMALDAEALQALHTAIIASGSASIDMKAAIEVVQRLANFASYDAAHIRASLSRQLMQPVMVNGAHLRVHRQGRGATIVLS